MNHWFFTWCGDKRLVNELRVKVASERKLATLRALGGKSVNKRLPGALRNVEGQPVEDQSCWGTLIHEHFGGNFRRENVQKTEATRVFWKMKVWEAQQHGQNPEELSFEEFLEVLSLVKPNVATGRDNVPGTVLRFLPESVQKQLYRAIVERLAGREDAHVKGRAEFDTRLVPEKGDISSCPTGVRSLWFLHFTKCMKCALAGFGQRAQTPPESVGGVQAWHAVPGHRLLPGGKFAESRRVGRKAVCCLYGCGKCIRLGQRPGAGRCASAKRGNYHLCGGSSEGKLGALCKAVHGIHKKYSFQVGCGYETGRPRDTIWLEPGDGGVG